MTLTFFDQERSWVLTFSSIEVYARDILVDGRHLAHRTSEGWETVPPFPKFEFQKVRIS